MKKFLLFLVIGAIVLNYTKAQKRDLRAKKDLPKAYLISKDKKIDVEVVVPILPVQRQSIVKTKQLEPVLIGTSGNAYTFIYEPNYQLDANTSVNMIAYVHRAGGPWGGSSGELKVKFTTDFGTTWDSVLFPIQEGNHYYRYPQVIIESVDSNNEVFFIVNGPITDGAGWKFNYFDSQRSDGEFLTVNHLQPVLSQGNSPILERHNLSGGNGKYYTTFQDEDEIYYVGKYYIRRMFFDYEQNKLVVDTIPIGPLTRTWKFRQFSNGTVPWAFAYNNVFDVDGLHGFIWTLGCDSLIDYYQETGTPIVWETTDGGESFIYWEPFGCWDYLSNVIEQVWPTLNSITSYPENPENWEYRIDFPAGSVSDENFHPGVIDINGDLHILALIEGRYSKHPDSLGYYYAMHPKLLFDVHTKTYNHPEYGEIKIWDAIFLDTLKTDVVLDDNSPFGDSDGKIGWGHNLNISISPDRKVIFALWTDTDPQYDTVNTLPGIKGRAWNIETYQATPVIDFTGENFGLYYFCNVSRFVLEDSSDYIIPYTYIDINEQPNAINPQNHYFLKGLRISKDMFTEQLQPSDLELLATCPNLKPLTGIFNKTIVKNFSINLFPIPAKDILDVELNLTEHADVSIVISNVIGEQMKTIYKGKLLEGKQFVRTNISDLKEGIYFVTVNVNGHKITKKLIVK